MPTDRHAWREGEGDPDKEEINIWSGETRDDAFIDAVGRCRERRRSQWKEGVEML